MRIVALRTGEERDRVYVHLDDGSEVSWSWASYGDALPHDLVHWVIESRLGLVEGFWGLVASGVDPARVSKAAERIATGVHLRDLTARDTSELVQAEMLTAAVNALGWQSPHEALAALVESCEGFGVELPEGFDAGRLTSVAAEVDSWAERWRALWPGDSLELEFPDPDPTLDEAPPG